MGARSIVSVPAATIDTVPAPMAENVKPVPAITVLAAGRVMVYELAPTRKTTQPDELADSVAFALNTIQNETEIPLPIAQVVAPYFAMIALKVLE